MADDIRSRILAVARSRFGIPYRMEPPPIWDTTADCSLYVREVFKEAGLTWPAGVRTAEQERQSTVPIGWGDVLPGDLLFFENTYPAGDGVASHIGISLGAGTKRMYDANDGRGSSGETNIATAYWQEHIVEARRHPALMAAEPAPSPPSGKPDPWQWWPAAQIAAASKCPLDAVRENWPKLTEQLHHCGLTDPNIWIGMIGTVAIESASTFRPVREAFYLGEPEPAESHRRTLRYYPFYGRGFIQNTWEANYRSLGPRIAELWGAGTNDPTFDLVANPDNLLDPDMSAAAGALYFRDHGGGALAEAARDGNWTEVRRLVLGGPDPKGVARITQIATALGPPASVPAPTPPAPQPPVQTVTRADLDALLIEARAQVARIELLRDKMPA